MLVFLGVLDRQSNQLVLLSSLLLYLLQSRLLVIPGVLDGLLQQRVVLVLCAPVRNHDSRKWTIVVGAVRTIRRRGGRSCGNGVQTPADRTTCLLVRHVREGK